MHQSKTSLLFSNACLLTISCALWLTAICYYNCWVINTLSLNLFISLTLTGENPVPIPPERWRCTIWPGQYSYCREQGVKTVSCVDVTQSFFQTKNSSPPHLYVYAVFESPAPPNQSPIQWPVCPSSAADAIQWAWLLQNALFSTTQSQWGYSAIDPVVPFVNEGEKTGIVSAKVRV